MPTIKIVSRYDSTKVLFECEVTQEQQDSGAAMRHALEKAAAARADLRGANLYGANLYGANLYGANLRSADLRGADLGGADLYGAYLCSADLYGAYLCSADLYGADLRSANLRSADLGGADLGGADLYGAYLCSADLYGADLRSANLRSADLGGKKLAGDRPFIQIGPIGSRSDYLLAFITDKGVMIRAGCFFDTRDQFEAQLAATHGANEHGQEYMAALALIDIHAELWASKVEAEALAA